MGTIIVKQSDDTSNSYSGSGVEWDEFIPFVDLSNPKDYNTANHELPLEKDKDNKYVYVDLLSQTKDSKKNKTITTLSTELKKPVLPFSVEKAGPDSYFEDDDGYIAVELSLEKDKYVKIEGATAQIKLKGDTEYGDRVLTKFGDIVEVEINITAEKSIDFYLRFLANDDEDTFKGEYENLFCGCMKMETIVVKSKIYFYSSTDGEFLGEIDSEFENNRTIIIANDKYKSFEKKKFISQNFEDERFKEDKFKFDWSLKNRGGLPSFGEIIHNYPTNKNGNKAAPSSDSYAHNQCAIRLSYGLINSNFSIAAYPQVNKTSEGYARSSKGLADWLHNNVFVPKKFKNPSEFKPDKSNGIIFLWDKSEGGISHIDVLYHGQTGSGYYGADEIWFWELK
ncbi:T6SS effector amidase Tae4 family protein [uncultured Aquimarina sp.]|uniref:T6SS effector amidase Tae4 family protein n=1 Tax=uncultured Aquimarina sp. TaxID=575652 RepID=UPI0026214FA5|nr:T6SS effector amidase Tae4 family protein [uncultured Aquimarina sp.]